ncbi:EcsC family protein [Fibrella sp. HMF5335]|uniref:EcsC family protein n=1 Tax=Fibrella rubiginis TaxID=2817060 RepID=A0A939GGV2_9BACT|nr:EcsC family protein [Fibrella rubiginis]MBO0936974.1 EcsC family protein [Fibrella rubiginis]
MTPYEKAAQHELDIWAEQMRKPPSLINRVAKSVQVRMNRLIPDKVHAVVTAAIKHMTRAVLLGSEYVAPKPLQEQVLEVRERQVKTRIKWYKRVGAAEGGLTGAAGFLVGLADFPLLLSLKMKLLYDIAALYGHDVSDYRERLYILYIFQLAFSSQSRRQEIFRQMEQWDAHAKTLPEDINQFDWLTFQQEYRDYIDLAKMLQLVPGIGAVVGVWANWRLLDELGNVAVMAYRMRVLAER